MARITNNRPDTVMIEILPGNKCNYSCWYCHPQYYSGSDPWPETEKILSFVNQVASRYEHVQLSLTGGEPTLWPKLSEFLQSLPPNVENQITSNGSRTLRYWAKLAPLLHSVTISVHMDRADIDHMVELGKLLKDRCEPFFWILFDPQHRFKIELLYSKLVEARCSVRAKMITKVGLEYNDEEKSRIEQMRKIFMNSDRKTIKPTQTFIDGVPIDINQDIMIPQLNRFSGWTCSIPSRRYYIDSDGSIYAGSCEIKKFGNVYGEWSLDDTPIVCSKEWCWCLDDIKVEKFQ